MHREPALMVLIMIIATAVAPVIGNSGVVHEQEETIFYPALDVSTRAVKARPNELYGDVWEEFNVTGRGVNIAVIDTGVDDGHETFAGKWVAGVDITDPSDPRDGTSNPDDRNGHGTMVAGSALGTGGASGDHAGVAPGAGLVEVKVANDLAGGFSHQEYLSQAVEWCIDHIDDDWGDEDPSNDGIQVISMSYATTGDDDGSSDLCQIVNSAVEHGIVVVIAMGNHGPDNDGVGEPGAADLAITVGGIDDSNTVDRADDEIWTDSARGPRSSDGDDDPYDELKPEVVAPAVDITSSAYSIVGQDGNGWSSSDGTSYATPHVSGLAALMLEANPDLTPFDIDLLLRQTAEARGEPTTNLSSKYNPDYGFGIIDAHGAVESAIAGHPASDVVCVIDWPSDLEHVAGVLTIEGRAWSDLGDIYLVEIDIDGMGWKPAFGTDEWTFEFDSRLLEDGNHTIIARAWVGDIQSPESERRIFVENGPYVPEDSDSDDEDLPFGLPGFEAPLVMMAIAISIMRRYRDH